MLDGEKYILLTTFRRDGTAVPTPVWAVPLDGGKLGLWTSSGSGKARRLAHTARVTVQACDVRGRIKGGTAPVEARAQMVTGPEYSVIHDKVKAKYGIMTSITKVLGQVGGLFKGRQIPYGDCGVVITPVA
jgi:hypothetical protein